MTVTVPHLHRHDVLAGWRLILACLGLPPTWRSLLSYARQHRAHCRVHMLDRALAVDFEFSINATNDQDALNIFLDAVGYSLY